MFVAKQQGYLFMTCMPCKQSMEVYNILLKSSTTLFGPTICVHRRMIPVCWGMHDWYWFCSPSKISGHKNLIIIFGWRSCLWCCQVDRGHPWSSCLMGMGVCDSLLQGFSVPLDSGDGALLALASSNVWVLRPQGPDYILIFVLGSFLH